MADRRRVYRQACGLDGRIFVPKISTAIPCTITDISSLGAFLKPGTGRVVPAHFDLTIGGSNQPRACRIARQESDGFGVEFLDPVRHEIETILEEFAFKEELVFEALNPNLDTETTLTRIRLRRTSAALLDLIARRSSIAWQSGEIIEHCAARPDATIAAQPGPSGRSVPYARHAVLPA
ncbi:MULTISPECIES: PilZ domain-containing protein [Methylobacterium]|uniref:PilZ domain-containing protein n=1 Tax=Methylobacterium TaxID=407 RepID=UPI000A9F0C44|nr:MULTISPECIES: PilZ domain-containing protein [Methylobacterium]